MANVIRMLQTAPNNWVSNEAIAQVVGEPSSRLVSIRLFDGSVVDVPSGDPARDAKQVVAFVQDQVDADDVQFAPLPEDRPRPRAV